MDDYVNLQEQFRGLPLIPCVSTMSDCNNVHKLLIGDYSIDDSTLFILNEKEFCLFKTKKLKKINLINIESLERFLKFYNILT